MVLTKVVDVEDTRYGTARSSVLDLGLGGRGITILNGRGRVDLGQGNINLG